VCIRARACVRLAFGASRLRCVSQDVCASLLLPLLARVVGGEGDSTVLLYGQTGGGKTHNLLAFIRCVQAELDALGSAVEVVFFEVGRNGCFDLLNERSKVALRADACDRVHVRGAATTTASTGDELASVLDGGLALRSTLATEANPMSSRSHAILAVTFTSSGQREAISFEWRAQRRS